MPICMQKNHSAVLGLHWMLYDFWQLYLAHCNYSGLIFTLYFKKRATVFIVKAYYYPPIITLSCYNPYRIHTCGNSVQASNAEGFQTKSISFIRFANLKMSLKVKKPNLRRHQNFHYYNNSGLWHYPRPHSIMHYMNKTEFLFYRVCSFRNKKQTDRAELRSSPKLIST